MIYINDIIQLEFAWRQFCRGARTYLKFLTFYFSQAVLIFYLKVILMHQCVWCSYKALQAILNLNWHINLISLMSEGHKENKQRNKHMLTQRWPCPVCFSVRSCLSPASQPASLHLFSPSPAWQLLFAAHVAAPPQRPALSEPTGRCAEPPQDWLSAVAEPDGGRQKSIKNTGLSSALCRIYSFTASDRQPCRWTSVSGDLFVSNLLSALQLRLYFFSPQLTLGQLSLQALHALSEGGRVSPRLS